MNSQFIQLRTPLKPSDPRGGPVTKKLAVNVEPQWPDDVTVNSVTAGETAQFRQRVVSSGLPMPTLLGDALANSFEGGGVERRHAARQSHCLADGTDGRCRPSRSSARPAFSFDDMPERMDNELPQRGEPEPAFVGRSWRCVCCGEHKPIAPGRHICEECWREGEQ